MGVSAANALKRKSASFVQNRNTLSNFSKLHCMHFEKKSSKSFGCSEFIRQKLLKKNINRWLSFVTSFFQQNNTFFKLDLFNSRSTINKSSHIPATTSSSLLDLLAFTETWVTTTFFAIIYVLLITASYMHIVNLETWWWNCSYFDKQDFRHSLQPDSILFYWNITYQTLNSNLHSQLIRHLPTT